MVRVLADGSSKVLPFLVTRDELVRDLKMLLAAGPPLRLALLFGSVARGSDHTGSDLDVPILPIDRELGLADELALQTRLALLAKREVDVVRLDPCTPELRFRVAREGVPLVGDRSVLNAFRARAGI
ncbi:MAG TPA: nucleotidyltransferase domain-containing protein, partial [Polyangiales bacterium]|nr:nucleotidyltransferase domain-containing protein [Polyangiales bacterium]